MKICECCGDPAQTTYEENWIDSRYAPRGLTLIEGQNIYHAFKGEICAGCKSDYMRPDEEVDVHVSRAQIREARTMGSMRVSE